MNLLLEPNCLENVGTEFVPCVAFGEDAKAQRASAEATPVRIANLEDQLREPRIEEQIAQPECVLRLPGKCPAPDYSR
jgi:hypothetical protein